MNRAWIVFVFKLTLLLGCYTETDKSKVEKINADRFSEKKDSKEAEFLVDAIDKSYAIIEVAQLGEEKLQDPVARGQAKMIVESQTNVGVRLKSFAESNDVTIPLSGPEKTSNRVKKLYEKNGRDFQEAWQKHLEDLHNELASSVMDFKEKADESMRNALDTTLMIMEENTRLIKSLDKPVDSTEVVIENDKKLKERI